LTLTPSLSRRARGRDGAVNPFSLGEKVAGAAGRKRVFASLRPEVITV
jgi:hypothetical protein